jgi:hypothetical protein
MPFDLEAVGLELAQAWYHLDLYRAISDKNTLAACWHCRLQPMPGRPELHVPFAKGGTAKEAVNNAMSLVAHGAKQRPEVA